MATIKFTATQYYQGILNLKKENEELRTQINKISDLNSANTLPNKYKIFISHSSIDKEWIDLFINQILRLGCGLETKDILCTSFEPYGITTGLNIRNYLRNHLNSCDYVFFMISRNYLKSTICLNEMGGAWVLEKDIKPYLFPSLDFKDMGWLYEVCKGAKINDEFALDELKDELSEKYKDIKRIKTSEWNSIKKKFINDLNTFISTQNEKKVNNLPQVAKKINVSIGTPIPEITILEILSSNPSISILEISNLIQKSVTDTEKIISDLILKSKIFKIDGIWFII